MRQPPKKFTGLANAHIFTTAEESYRASFFSALDKAYAQLGECLDRKSSLLTLLQHSGIMCGSDFRDVESDEDPASVVSQSASQEGSSNGYRDCADSLRQRLQLELAKRCEGEYSD